MNFLLKNIQTSKGKIIKAAIHDYKPYENIMAREVSKFVLETKWDEMTICSGRW